MGRIHIDVLKYGVVQKFSHLALRRQSHLGHCETVAVIVQYSSRGFYGRLRSESEYRKLKVRLRK